MVTCQNIFDDTMKALVKHLETFLAAFRENSADYKVLLRNQRNAFLNQDLLKFCDGTSLLTPVESLDIFNAYQMLLYGADVNFRDEVTHSTPAMKAALGGDTVLLELLHSWGADFEIKDARDQKPLDVARQRGLSQSVAFLAAHQTGSSSTPSSPVPRTVSGGFASSGSPGASLPKVPARPKPKGPYAH